MQLDLCESAPAEWLRLPISAVCKRFTSGGTPSRRVPDYFVGEIPWVKTQELTDCILEETGEHISQEAVAASSAKLLPERTVLMAMYGATVGQLGVLAKPMTCNQACAAMVVDSDKADYRYLYYQLMAARKQIKSLSTGAAQQNLSGAQIKQFVLPFPPLWEQSAIADVLWQIDRRITLLRQTNATLESIAQALFKSWFIDFDPVRAKAEGREPEGMDAAMAALFPAEFEESALGLIPRGWRAGRVADLGTVVCGKTPPTANSANYGDEIPFVTIPDMHNKLVVTQTGRMLSVEGADSQPKKYLPSGSVLVSCIATPGLVVTVDALSQTNQQINSVLPAEPWGGAFSLFALQRVGDAVRTGGAGGSVFSNLSKSGFEQLGILLPTPHIAEAFNGIVGPLVAKVASNQRHARVIGDLRDALLPRLISGKLRFPEAQAQLEEVIA